MVPAGPWGPDGRFDRCRRCRFRGRWVCWRTGGRVQARSHSVAWAVRVRCERGASAVRPTARRVPSTGRFTEGFDNEPIRRPSGLARRGRRRCGPARTGTSCSVPSPTGSGALREGARSQSTHRPGRALPTRRAATAASGELGVWAAEGLRNDLSKSDSSESRRRDFLDVAKGSRTPESATCGGVGVLPPRLLASGCAGAATRRQAQTVPRTAPSMSAPAIAA